MAKYCDPNKSEKKHSQALVKQKKRKFPLKHTSVIAAIAILIAAGVGVLVYFDIINAPTDESGTVRTYDNGDTICVPDDRNIAYDEETFARYYDNQLVVYTFQILTEKEAASLAKTVNGVVVGQISGAINMLQIRVESSSLEELSNKSNLLMESKAVMFATYEYPIELSSCLIWTDPWSNNTDNPEADRANRNNPDGNDWWAEAIDAYTAWDDDTECAEIKIGILDQGFYDEHDDLAGKITYLEGYSNNTAVNHGTAIAGIIGANNNDIGIRGIADQAHLICVDWTPYTEDSGAEDYVGYISSGEYIEIIKQLVEADVKVINNSWANIVQSLGSFSEDYNQIRKYLDPDLYGKDDDTESRLAYDNYLSANKLDTERTAEECIVLIVQLIINGYDDFIIVQAAGNGYDNAGPGVDANYSGFFDTIDESIYNWLATKSNLLYVLAADEKSFSEEEKDEIAKRGITYSDVKDHIIIVGAVENFTDEDGNYRMAEYSNYGANVDICAPGGDGSNTDGIFTTIYNEKENKYEYGNLVGTSLAAPMVTASAALVWSKNPSLTAGEVKGILKKSAKVNAIGVGDDARRTYPMLNVGAAVKMAVREGSDVPDYIPLEAVEYNGHYYYIYTDEMSWEDAKEYCESVNGYLITITDEAEQSFVWNYVNDFAQLSSDSYWETEFWLGATDSKREGVWKWANGEEFSYTNWGTSEPDDAFGGQDSAVMVTSLTEGTNNFGNDYSMQPGQWDDIALHVRSFICEWGTYETAQLDAEEVIDAFLTAQGYLEYTEGFEISSLEYAITDLNADDIPELLIQSWEGNTTFCTTWVFVVDGQDMVLAHEAYGYGSFRYSPVFNAVVVSPEFRPFAGTADYPFYVLDGTELKYEFRVGQNDGTSYYADSQGRKDISDDEHSAYFSDLVSFEWSSIL